MTTCVCSTIRPKQCNRVATSSSDCQLAVICHPVPPPHTATSAHTALAHVCSTPNVFSQQTVIFLMCVLCCHQPFQLIVYPIQLIQQRQIW